MKTISPVQLKVLDPRVKDFGMPQYSTQGSGALDLRAMPQHEFTLNPNECQLVPTGLSIYVSDPGLAAIVIPRSGLGSREGIVLGNLVGLIDSDYQGPLQIPCWNRGEVSKQIKVGDRIAQMMLVPIAHFEWEVVSEFSSPTDRGEKGFGSSGTA